MEQQLLTLINNFSGDVTLYAHNLATDKVVSINSSDRHPCASEAKIYLLLIYAEQVTSKTLNPNLQIEFKESDIVPGSGVLRFANPHLQPTASFLAYLMMAVSDNTATNMLFDLLGGSIMIQATLNRLRISNTIVAGKLWQSDWITSTASDLALAAKIIAEPKMYGYPIAAAELCKQIMARHFEDNGMPRFLPWSPFAEDVKTMPLFHDLIEEYAGIEYYGKAGAIPGYRGDVALFIAKSGTYVVGMQCRNVQDKRPLNAANEGYTFSAEIGKLFYEHWANGITL